MTLNKSKIFLLVCVSFIVGIFLGRWATLAIMAVAAMIFVILGSLGWQKPLVRLAAFLGLALVLGSLRFIQTSEQFIKADFGKVSFTGVICEESDNRPDKTLLTLCGAKINQSPVSYKILATVRRFPEYAYGDRVEGVGKIQLPKDAEQPGEFSYRDYLSRYGIMSVVYYPKLNKTSSGQGSKLKGLLLAAKQKFIAAAGGILPEPENSFLAGLLVGAKRGIPADIMQDFSDTGTTHIIAISGFNITIIAGALDKLLRRFGRRVSFILSLLSIGLFVVLTGASSSVVRAGMMGALGLIALNIGRTYAITNALVLTAAVMLAINPKLLMFDVGFQLSFLALMGLVYLSPLLEPYFTRIPTAIRVFLVATLAAQIFTLPILLYNFDRLSLVSPLANVLVLPLVPPAMLVGFITGALALLYPVLALPAAWVTWFLLALILKIVNVLARLPFASLNLSASIWFVWGYYAALAAILVAANRGFRIPQFVNVLWKKEQKA